MSLYTIGLVLLGIAILGVAWLTVQQILVVGQHFGAA
jgi:hypothetical protein